MYVYATVYMFMSQVDEWIKNARDSIDYRRVNEDE